VTVRKVLPRVDGRGVAKGGPVVEAFVKRLVETTSPSPGAFGCRSMVTENEPRRMACQRPGQRAGQRAGQWTGRRPDQRSASPDTERSRASTRQRPRSFLEAVLRRAHGEAAVRGPAAGGPRRDRETGSTSTPRRSDPSARGRLEQTRPAARRLYWQGCGCDDRRQLSAPQDVAEECGQPCG